MIRFPGPGCIVEFMQGNRAQQALVLEEHSGAVRLYTLKPAAERSSVCASCCRPTAVLCA